MLKMRLSWTTVPLDATQDRMIVFLNLQKDNNYLVYISAKRIVWSIVPQSTDTQSFARDTP